MTDNSTSLLETASNSTPSVSTEDATLTTETVVSEEVQGNTTSKEGVSTEGSNVETPKKNNPEAWYNKEGLDQQLLDRVDAEKYTDINMLLEEFTNLKSNIGKDFDTLTTDPASVEAILKKFGKPEKVTDYFCEGFDLKDESSEGVADTAFKLNLTNDQLKGLLAFDKKRSEEFIAKNTAESTKYVEAFKATEIGKLEKLWGKENVQRKAKIVQTYVAQKGVSQELKDSGADQSSYVLNSLYKEAVATHGEEALINPTERTKHKGMNAVKDALANPNSLLHTGTPAEKEETYLELFQQTKVAVEAAKVNNNY